MRKVKIFDVVELQNGEKATVLNGNEENMLVEVAGENKRHIVINIKDIKNIIYTK